jgi:hypothetical protein
MTTVINLSDIDFSFFEKLKKQFGDKDVRITIDEAPEKVSQMEIFRKLEALQKKYPPKKIDPSIDIRALIDETHDPKIEF